MRIGPLEIVLVIALVIAAAVIVRVVRAGKKSSPRGKPEREVAVKRPERTAGARSLNRTGIILVVAGIVALIAAASFFRLALQSYLFAFIILAIGYLLIVMSRRKR